MGVGEAQGDVKVLLLLFFDDFHSPLSTHRIHLHWELGQHVNMLTGIRGNVALDR